MKKSEKTLVSVIVPVYNSEKFLEECINSLLNQNSHNFELILVDDGSTDSSPIICETFARYSNIRVFHKENGGVGSARNFGLKMAKGDWIVFVDSDDVVTNSYISYLYKSVSEDKIELAVCNLYTDSTTGVYECLIPKFSNITLSEMLINIGLLRSLGPCCKIFNKQILEQHQICFPENYSYGEDTVFTLRYLLHVKHCSFIPQSLYYYRDSGAESLSHKLIKANEFISFMYDYMHLLDKIYEQTDCQEVFIKQQEILLKQSLHLAHKYLKRGIMVESKNILRSAYIISNVPKWNSRISVRLLKALCRFESYSISLLLRK